MAEALVVRLSSLGDVILTTPVFDALKAAGWRTSALVKRAFAPVFAGNPSVDEVLVFEDRGLLGWAAEIRRRRFGAVVDLHDTPRSRLWGWCAGARVVRYDKRARERRRLVRTKEVSPRLAGRVVDRYLEVLPVLGLPAAGRLPRIHLKDALSPAVAARAGAGPFIAVAPGAAHATKRWPAERFAAAADALSAGAVTLLVGSREDRSACDAVAARMAGPALNFAGETSLRDLFHLLARCRLAVTNDSGAMHAAAALGVPTAAVFGPTVEPFGFFPEGPAAVVQNDGLPCRPCHLHGGAACPLGHFRCMRDLTADRVVEAARKL